MPNDFENSRHIAYICPGTNAECRSGTCKFCNDELTACILCYSMIEGHTMTTQCIGHPLTAEQTNDVEDGKTDYRGDGVWVNEPSPYARKKD